MSMNHLLASLIITRSDDTSELVSEKNDLYDEKGCIKDEKVVKLVEDLKSLENEILNTKEKKS